VRGKKRYKVQVFLNMNNPFNALYSMGRSRFISDDNLTKRDAIREIRRIKTVYPYAKTRIKRSKGIATPIFILGLAVFVFSLAIANNVNTIFNYSAEMEDLLQIGFLILALFGLVYGLFKGLGG